MFNVKDTLNKCVRWIRDYFDENGKGCNAIIGISGGKDSSIVAALCVVALGKERVIGVLMPSGEQSDIDYSYELCTLLGIKSFVVNIGKIESSFTNSLTASLGDEPLSEQSKLNIPPRIRMTTLYAISASFNGRVANTCNYSEDYVGYSTKYGDAAGDFSPLSNLTVQEVKALGVELGLPSKFIDKVPSDGLCGKSDEDNLGFTYKQLDKYIREGQCDDEKIRKLIDKKHMQNLHKLKPMPAFSYSTDRTKRFSVIGAVAGDIVGMTYKSGYNNPKEFPLFGKKPAFSENTVLSAYIYAEIKRNGIADMSDGQIIDLLANAVSVYCKSERKSVMHVLSVGNVFDSVEAVKRFTRLVCMATNTAPEVIRDAEACALCVFLTRIGFEKDRLRSWLVDEYGYDLKERRCVPTAVTAFLTSTNFEDALRNAIAFGGSSLTASITGSIAEVYYGVPDDIENNVKSSLTLKLREKIYK